MLQGIYKKLKQPVAYYFVKGTISSQSLAVLIKTVIKALTDIGYIILTTVCDQGPTNIGSLNFLKKNVGLPTDLNYFMLDGMKIFIMFDIPHLFKSIRNNFYQGGELVLDEHNAKWSHLIELEEKNKSTLHFKKITALHVNPKFRSKMKVKLAVQVLSNTVAAILKLLAETYADGQKRQEVLETARIVEDLDRLFDCTNGPASRNDIKKHRRENVSKKTNHIVLWNKYKSKIKSMHFIKSDSRLRLKNVRCVQGYLTSLCSLEDIWKFVESKGFKYLNLRQLNQDALENLFGMIRQHCPTNRNPTCHHFTAALKSNILTKLSTPVSRGGNCEEDNNVALIDFEDFLQPISQGNNERVTELSQLRCSTDRETFPTLHLEEEEDIEELEREETLFTSFEKQPTVYVAGYLASVVLKKIHWQCDGCTLCLTIEHPEQKPELYNYIALREWWNDKKSLTYPTLHLCKLIDCASLCFEELIKPNLQEINISERTVTMMLANFDNLSWVCTEHKDKLLEVLLLRLAHLLIRNECNRTNFTFATAEEHVADVNKKAQQQQETGSSTHRHFSPLYSSTLFPISYGLDFVTV